MLTSRPQTGIPKLLLCKEKNVSSESEDISIGITGLAEWEIPPEQLGRGLTLLTNRGPIQTIIHHDPNKPTYRGVVWVGGAKGGFDGPGDGLYRMLGKELSPGITSIRANYREPNDLTECVMDTLAAVSFLGGTGHTDILLVGHSFGGAVVIKAAPFSDLVKGVVSLSSQTYGASEVANVSPRPLLLVHGENDTVLSPDSSRRILEWAQEPKELKLYPGAGHGLRECGRELRELVGSWIQNHLFLPGETDA